MYGIKFKQMTCTLIFLIILLLTYFKFKMAAKILIFYLKMSKGAFKSINMQHVRKITLVIILQHCFSRKFVEISNMAPIVDQE